MGCPVTYVDSPWALQFCFEMSVSCWRLGPQWSNSHSEAFGKPLTSTVGWAVDRFMMWWSSRRSWKHRIWKQWKRMLPGRGPLLEPVPSSLPFWASVKWEVFLPHVLPTIALCLDIGLSHWIHVTMGQDLRNYEIKWTFLSLSCISCVVITVVQSQWTWGRVQLHLSCGRRPRWFPNTCMSFSLLIRSWFSPFRASWPSP